jgi:hypothetical protein
MLMRRDGDGQFSISDAEPTDTSERQAVQLAVSGMRCPECMLRAGAGVIFMEGVREVMVRLDGGELRILLAQDARPNAELLALGVRNQGYAVELIAPAVAR